MDKNAWNVGEAKQQFSEVLRRSADEPQLIYRRNRLIAKVVAVDEAAEGKEPPTLADLTAKLREIARRENYRLPSTRRTTRRNDFVEAIDGVAARHERRK